MLDEALDKIKTEIDIILKELDRISKKTLGQPKLATEGIPPRVKPDRASVEPPQRDRPYLMVGNSSNSNRGSNSIRQGSDNLDELYQEAQKAQEYLSQTTKEIADRLGGEPLIPTTLKGRERALEKIAADYNGDASKITDLARSSIIFENPKQIDRALDELQKKFNVVRVKNRFQKPASGYRDILLNLEMPNGHIVEMQLHLRSILEVKNGIGHELYEQIRSIQVLAKKEGRDLTPQEDKRIRDLTSQMKKLYDKAFEKSSSVES